MNTMCNDACYKECEDLKNEAWKAFYETTSIPKKSSILMHGIIQAHYWRARESLEERKDCKKCLQKIFKNKYCPGYEMDIDHYTEHWLFSMKNAPFMTPELYEICSEWYEPKESIYLPPGCTIYQI